MLQRGAGMPCTIDADVVQFVANGAPHTRAALVPYLSRFTLAGVTGFFTRKAVRHSLLAKLTIPITTVRSAHTAMIVCVSIGFSDLSKPPRATKHRAHCSAMWSHEESVLAARAPRSDRREAPRIALCPRTQSGHNALKTTSFYL